MSQGNPGFRPEAAPSQRGHFSTPPDRLTALCADSGRTSRSWVIALLVWIPCSVFTQLSTGSASAQIADSETQLVTPFLAEPLPTERSATTRPRILSDLLQARCDPTIFLVSDQDWRASLLVGANRSGFGTPLPLSVEGYHLHLAEGTGETLWIGGYDKPTMSMFSKRQSFAYLAKIDRQGHLFWQREFGGETERKIQSLVALSSGDVVVSGRDDDRTWLARISGDGNIVWERYVGLGRGSALTTIGGNIVLAAVEVLPPDLGFCECIAVWTLTPDGEVTGHRVIREISLHRREHETHIRLEKGSPSLYVFSSWEFFLPDDEISPLEVAKLDTKMDVVWRKELPMTVVKFHKRKYGCTTAATVLSTDDVLISCHVSRERTLLLRLNATNGNLSQTEIWMSEPPPGCSSLFKWPPARFLKEISQKSVWMIGSPHTSEENPCAWIAEAATPDPR